MVIGDVVHRELSVALRKGQSVLDPIGVEGVIVGFKSSAWWFGHRSNRVAWVIVKSAGGIRSYRSAAELRVVEKSIEMEGQSA